MDKIETWNTENNRLIALLSPSCRDFSNQKACPKFVAAKAFQNVYKQSFKFFRQITEEYYFSIIGLYDCIKLIMGLYTIPLE